MMLILNGKYRFHTIFPLVGVCSCLLVSSVYAGSALRGKLAEVLSPTTLKKQRLIERDPLHCGIPLRNRDGTTYIQIIAKKNSERSNSWYRNFFQATPGCVLDAISPSYVRFLVVPENLSIVKTFTEFEFLREPATFEMDGMSGNNVSEAVSLVGATLFHDQGITGEGVSVAVVDADFFGLDDAIAAGEVPGAVTREDFTGTGMESGSPHGVAVTEQVHDLAPGASLYCLKVQDLVDFENAINYIHSNGIDIVNLSLSWFGQSYYDDTGPFTMLVNESRDQQGVFWVTSAGNNARGHWSGNWSDTDGDGFLNFLDTLNSLSITDPVDSFTIYLNWDQYDESRRRMADLDLYVLNGNSDIVASSNASQWLSGIPAEAVRLGTDTTEDYGIVVENYENTSLQDVGITLFVRSASLQNNRPGMSMAEPGCAAGACAVGAVHEEEWGAENPTIAPYSAHGPTTDRRMKPDITAPDGTSSLSYGVKGGFGTSLAAPVVAGAAALLYCAYTSWTADSLDYYLVASSRDAGSPGVDSLFGAGLLDLEPLAPEGTGGLLPLSHIHSLHIQKVQTPAIVWNPAGRALQGTLPWYGTATGLFVGGDPKRTRDHRQVLKSVHIRAK